MKYIACLLSFLIGTALASEPAPGDSGDFQQRLDFVVSIQKFQGMFDSVVAFCGSHVPALILRNSKAVWLSNNQHYLDLRDKELSKLIEVATANGASSEGITQVRTWVEEQYQSRLHHDRLYKDLIGADDLTIPCSRRLGEMVSNSMSLEALSPESVAYLRSTAIEP